MAVRSLRRKGARVEAVHTDRGEFRGDAIVAALGSYTPLLLRPLGIRIPIYPVKGVTVTVSAAAWPDRVKMPIIDDTRLFGLVPLGDRLRVSGSAEITGFDTEPSPARCQAIVDNVHPRVPEIRRLLRSGNRALLGRTAPGHADRQAVPRAQQIRQSLRQCRARPSRLDHELRLGQGARRCRGGAALGRRARQVKFDGSLTTETRHARP